MINIIIMFENIVICIIYKVFKNWTHLLSIPNGLDGAASCLGAPLVQYYYNILVLFMF